MSGQTPDNAMQLSMVFLASIISSQLRSWSFLMCLEGRIAAKGRIAMLPSTWVNARVSWLIDLFVSAAALSRNNGMWLDSA